ncbi:MAG: TIGR03032 family protein [Bacteroidota bacterium]
MSATELPPFTTSFTPRVPELLSHLRCSLMLSTYQAGKVVCISPMGESNLVSLARSFDKPMGIASNVQKMAIACKDHLIVLENSPALAKNYPKKRNVYDSMYVPRITFHTGIVDIHDIAFGKQGIWAINTSFSCLCLINGHYNFIPKWKPAFITELEGEDRCHLNGLVVEEGVPRFVTALGSGNEPESWRENITTGGVLIDLKTDQIAIDSLPMPHSPTLYKGRLYALLSAAGQLVQLVPEDGRYEVITSLNGFCRGLAIYGDHAFVGMSKLREGSSTFDKLDFPDGPNEAGIMVVHLPSKTVVGKIKFETSVEEIYELKLLPDTLRPNLLNTMNPIHNYSLAIPEKTFWADENHEVFKGTQTIKTA